MSDEDDRTEVEVSFSKSIDEMEVDEDYSHEPGDSLSELEGSFDIAIPADTVTCPNCNYANSLPPSPFLQVLTDEPYPCDMCGYPLR